MAKRLDSNKSGVKSPQENKRSQAEIKKEVRHLHAELRRYVKGKPTKPAHFVSIPTLFARGIGKIVKLVALILVLVILFLGGSGVGILMGYINTTTEVEQSLLTSGPRTSYMYDTENNLIAKMTGYENIDRVHVDYAAVKDTYIDEAFIAVEDETFLTNIGINPKRIFSAVLSALANGGAATHGGSTITQQTVKLITGENQRSAQRKIQEWYRAIMLKQKLTNDEIMELYINSVPMGNSYVGIETAANAYFNKKAKDLTLIECAYLAGIPRGPSLYNPLTESGLRNGLRRQRMILGKMYEQGMISQAQYRESINAELVFSKDEQKVSGTSINSYLTEYAKEQAVVKLAEAKNISESEASDIINNQGVKIYTTQEPNVQAAVDRAFSDNSLFNQDPEDYADSLEKPQLGQAIINNQNFSIAAMGGGTYEKTGNLVLNRAVDIRRQPGSTIKPLVSYGPGIDTRNVTGATIFDDTEVFLDPSRPDTPYPTNLGGTYYGLVSVRNALKWSLNIESAQILLKTGVNVGKQYLKDLGMDRMSDGAQLAIAMGAFEQGMSPLQVAAGFAALANGGSYAEPIAFTRIENADGSLLLENKPNYVQVFKPETAYMMTTIMRETLLPANSSFGLPGTAYGENYDTIYANTGDEMYSVGKSGTTEYDYDRWFSGYSYYYTSSVWNGFDTQQELPRKNFRAAEKVYFNTMAQIHSDLDQHYFDAPPNIITMDVCNKSGELATSACYAGNHVQEEYFDRTSPLTPTRHCSIHGYVRRVSPSTEASDATESSDTPSDGADNAGDSSGDNATEGASEN